MELTNEIRLSLSPEDAWHLLTDIERIAPCLPGATLDEVDGDEYRGRVKVKVGPATAQYKGTATFAERDDDARRGVIEASGRDVRGQGTASATVSASVDPDGSGSRVEITTELQITGRVAQFGRGVMEDVSRRLINQFADNLEQMLSEDRTPAEPTPPVAEQPGDGDRPGSDGGTPTTTTAPRPPVERREAEAVDLLDVAGGAMAKRLVPVLVVVIVLVVLFRRRSRRR